MIDRLMVTIQMIDSQVDRQVIVRLIENYPPKNVTKTVFQDIHSLNSLTTKQGRAAIYFFQIARRFETKWS